MPILQTFICDICGDSYTETSAGDGAGGWGSFNGIIFNRVANPILCPKHKGELADKLDIMAEEFANDLG